MVGAGPERVQARNNLCLVGEQANFFPSLILQVVIDFGRDAKVPGYVQMIVRSLKILDPAFARNTDLGVLKEVYICRRIGLERCHQNLRNLFWRKPLRAKDILRQLLVGADDLGFWKTEEIDPCLVENRKVLWWAGINEDIVPATTDQVDDDVHLFACAPGLHPIDLRPGKSNSTGIERLNRIVHTPPPCRTLVVSAPATTDSRNALTP